MPALLQEKQWPLQGPNGWSCERLIINNRLQHVREIWRKDGPLDADDLEVECVTEEEAKGDAEGQISKKPATKAMKATKDAEKKPETKAMQAKKNKDAQKKPATKAIMKAQKNKDAQKKPAAKDVTAKKRPATKGSP